MKKNQEYTQENDERTQTKYMTIKLYICRKQRRKQKIHRKNIDRNVPKRPRAVKEPIRNMGNSKLTINQWKTRITDQEDTTDIDKWEQSKESEKDMRLEREDHVLSNWMIRTWDA